MSRISLKISKPLVYSTVIVLAIAIALIAIESSRAYTAYWWKKQTREQAAHKLAGEVARIQNIILSIEQLPQNLAYVLEFSTPKKEHLQFLLDAVVANNDEVFGACIAFEPNSFERDSTFYAPYLYKRDGVLVYTDPTDSTDNYFSSDWYLIPKTLKQPVWIEPYIDGGLSGGNTVMATYSVPFYSFDGKKEAMHGIVAVDISIEWLSKLVSLIKLEDESYTMLISENGTVLSAPEPLWVYNESLFSLADEAKLPVLREIGRDLQKGNSGFVNVGKLDGQKEWWIYYAPIPANKWGLLLVVLEG